MERISDIISKRVVSIEEGKCVGFILNACLSEELDKLEGYLVVDEESERVNFLPIKNVFANKSEFVLIESADSLLFGETMQSFNPINKKLLSKSGEDFGVVRDVEIAKNRVVKIITDRLEVYPKNIYSQGEEFLFFAQSRNSKKNKKIFPNVNNFDALPKIEIQNNNIGEKMAKNAQLPYKISNSSSNIIGKIATTDIFGYNNELIIKKNEKITAKTIKEAKKHNKLNYLLFNNR